MHGPADPICLVLPGDAAGGWAPPVAALETALRARQWRVVVQAVDADAPLPAEIDAIALVILLHTENEAGACAARLRAAGGTAATVPVIARGTTADTTSVDATVPFEGGIDALVAAAEAWRPDAGAATLDRLAVAFGADQLDHLAAGLRAMLVKALAAAPGPDRRGLAHRIAGLAGSLGFGNVSRSWLAVAAGESGAEAQARIDARCAIAAIDRRQSIAAPKT